MAIETAYQSGGRMYDNLLISLHFLSKLESWNGTKIKTFDLEIENPHTVYNYGECN